MWVPTLEKTEDVDLKFPGEDFTKRTSSKCWFSLYTSGWLCVVCNNKVYKMHNYTIDHDIIIVWKFGAFQDLGPVGICVQSIPKRQPRTCHKIVQQKWAYVDFFKIQQVNPDELASSQVVIFGIRFPLTKATTYIFWGLPDRFSWIFFWDKFCFFLEVTLGRFYFVFVSSLITNHPNI